MDQNNQNKQQQLETLQKLVSHIQNRKKIKQMYKNKGIQMLDKPQLLIADIVDPVLKPTIQNIYLAMQDELSNLGYSEFKYLGLGAQGLVLLAKEKETNRRFAIKGIQIRDSKGNLYQESINQANQEIEMLNKCKGSPYVVKFFKKIEGKEYIYIVLNECQGTLMQIFEKYQNQGLNEITAIKYAKDIAEGLYFIHSKICIVNDLKFDNILIDYNGNAVISDFGCADHLTNQSQYSLHEYMGNFLFQAPECYDPLKYNQYSEEYRRLGVNVQTNPSNRSEACSLGYLLYTMITGVNFNLTFNKHLPMQYNNQFQNFIYKEQLQNIIDGLTQFIPRNRMSIRNALIVLKGILSFEFQLDRQFIELMNGTDEELFNYFKQKIEFVQDFEDTFYPIIKNEQQIIQEIHQKANDQKIKQEAVIEELKSKINALEKTNYDLKNQMKNQENETKKQDDVIKELKQSDTILKQKAKAQENTIEDLQKQLQKQLNENQKIYSQIFNEQEIYKQEKNKLEERIAEFKQSDFSLKQKISQQEKSIKDLENQLQNYIQKLSIQSMQNPFLNNQQANQKQEVVMQQFNKPEQKVAEQKNIQPQIQNQQINEKQRKIGTICYNFPPCNYQVYNQPPGKGGEIIGIVLKEEWNIKEMKIYNNQNEKTCIGRVYNLVLSKNNPNPNRYVYYEFQCEYELY